MLSKPCSAQGSLPHQRIIQSKMSTVPKLRNHDLNEIKISYFTQAHFSILAQNIKNINLATRSESSPSQKPSFLYFDSFLSKMVF